MATLTANELKTKGASSLDEAMKDDDEVTVTVRGKEKYVVMELKRYNFLRECELEAALAESLRDIKEGNIVEESVEEHIKRLKSEV